MMSELTSNVELVSNVFLVSAQREDPLDDPDFRRHVRGREAIQAWLDTMPWPEPQKLNMLTKEQLSEYQEGPSRCINACNRVVVGPVIRDGLQVWVDLCKQKQCYHNDVDPPLPQAFPLPEQAEWAIAASDCPTECCSEQPHLSDASDVDDTLGSLDSTCDDNRNETCGPKAGDNGFVPGDPNRHNQLELETELNGSGHNAHGSPCHAAPDASSLSDIQRSSKRDVDSLLLEAAGLLAVLSRTTDQQVPLRAAWASRVEDLLHKIGTVLGTPLDRPNHNQSDF